MGIEIALWQTSGLVLIVKAPTGIQFSNQTGGTNCLHPVVEGLAVPVRNEGEEGAADGRRSREFRSPEHELVEYFDGPKYEGSGATWGLDEADADFIDGVLERWRLAPCLEVDRWTLHESHEAWVAVTILGDDPEGTFAGLGPYPRPGILTWQNSD